MPKTLEIKLFEILEIIVKNSHLHARWLNTLSYLENCGARMIAACEHPTKVKEIVLKHAAEEFRHAHHLKRQIKKVSSSSLISYSLPFVLGGYNSLHYLKRLNLKTCTFLKEEHISSLVEYAYILVTYAIEKRAEKLYQIYDKVLRKYASPVKIRSIFLEEKEHLKEMEDAIALLPNGASYASAALKEEEKLFTSWISSINLLTKKFRLET